MHKLLILQQVAVHTLALLLTTGIFAQESVGEVKRIADISGQKPDEIETRTNKLQILHGFRARWLNAGPDSKLFKDDIIRLYEEIVAELRINRKDKKGKFFIRSDTTLQTGSERAEYVIREDVEKISFILKSGLVVVEWIMGGLEVIMGGTRNNFENTKALFIAKNPDEGIVFLEKGVITFPQYRGIRLNHGEAMQLRRGRSPEKLNLTPTQKAQFKKLIEFNSKDVWPRPWYKNPLYYIGAAAISGGIYYAIIKFVIPSKTPTNVADGEPLLPNPPPLPK